MSENKFTIIEKMNIDRDGKYTESIIVDDRQKKDSDHVHFDYMQIAKVHDGICCGYASFAKWLKNNKIFINLIFCQQICFIPHVFYRAVQLSFCFLCNSDNNFL